MNKDLRTFLTSLQEDHPEHLVRVVKEISPVLEVPVVQQRLAKEDRFPVVYVEKVQGFNMPLVTNLFGSYDLLGLAFGVEDRSRILKEYMRRESNAIPTKKVLKSQAPVKEVIWTGADVDLNRLPIVHHAEKDSGKYVVIGCMVCEDPYSGTPNVGIYRHEVKGKDKLGCMFNPHHHASYIYHRYQEMGRPMEVAIFIGHHPAVGIGASSQGSLDTHNEYETMGGLLGEPLEVVDCETISLEVPAWAEMVIEGVIEPGNVATDGPFAEYAGYYGEQKKVCVMDVKAITMRKDALYHDLDPAHREHTLSGVLPFESHIFRRVYEVVPSILDVYMPPSGCCFYTVYISMRKRVEGEGRFAAIAALGSNANLKMAVVVDEDIDVHSETEVLWAISTRCEADLDMTLIPHTLGAHLDPSSYDETRFRKGPMTTKLIIDATKKVNLPFAERIRPRKDVWEKITLSDYLGK
jgi:2,5-furandicarboxylate decarboxylase 1